MATFIRRETPAEHVARIVLARPETRNAQSPEFLYELDEAFLDAATDESVKVIILAADGPDFSSGHDLRAGFGLPGPPVATMEGGFAAPGVEGHHAFECEASLGMCKRWHDLPKPTIAQAQGRSIAGALMLLWPMDLIIAAEGVTFADPVTAYFGVNGVEYFAHAWELGARKAKELLFTGDPISAQEAAALGMVNQVVPADQLADFTLDLAVRIARRPAFGLRLAKASVNQSLQAQGRGSAIDAAFTLHTLGHAHNLVRHGRLLDPEGAEAVRRDAGRSAPPRI